MILLALNEQILKGNSIIFWSQYMNLAHLFKFFTTNLHLLVNLQFV